MKRAFDWIVSLIGLILISPLLGLIALAIRKDSPGPIFYSGKRIGMGGKTFNIYKFRTMYEVPESYSGPKVTAHNDPRITNVGRWLRDTKLNELPQLWNVFIGDMSLVGPRPEDPELANTWPLNARDEILSVRPGITSPASLQYRNEEFLLTYSNLLPTYFQELSPDKNRMDQLYVRHHSFWLDLDTLFWTFLLLLPRIGAHTPPEEMLFVGPITRLARQYIPWFVIDIFVTLISMAAAGLLWRVPEDLQAAWLLAVGFSLLFSLTGALRGVNRISWNKATFVDAFDLLPCWALATLVTNLFNEVSGLFSSRLMLTTSVFALAGYFVVRYRSRLLYELMDQYMRRLSSSRVVRERVLIIGCGALAQQAVWMLTHPMNAMKYWIVGFVDDDLFRQGRRMYGATVVGKINDLPRLIEEYDVGVVIMADYRRNNRYHSILELCQKTKARMFVLPDFLAVFHLLSSPGSPLMIPISGQGFDLKLNCIECMSKYGIVKNEPIEGAEYPQAGTASEGQ